MAIKCLIKTSQYADSVTLMTIAHELKGLPGIKDAALVMGTEANKGLLIQAELLTPEVQGASANDLILAIKGDSEFLDQALDTATKMLSQGIMASETIGQQRPRSQRTVFKSRPNANLVVISVAGRYAANEAWTALRKGLHVLLFSDNVSLADEVALKRYAVEHELLMMGPGAGTAIINGLALGFANVVPRGPVGIISAAGTGLQEVSSLLARLGVGISQAIGVGGRDLSDEVGGLMALHALEALKADTETKVIVAISKLPSPAIAKKVLKKLGEANKPAVVIFMGAEPIAARPASQTGKRPILMASTLEEAALKAAALAQGTELEMIEVRLARQKIELQRQAQDLKLILKPDQMYLRGLFSGGTLCEEAMQIWSDRLGPIWSNRPLKPEFKLPDSNRSLEHCALDLGEEEFTVGRLHPMINYDLRIRRLLQEAGDPSVAAIQMDIVLGYGAHPDPASELGPAIEQARQIARDGGRELVILLSIIGTDADPQNPSHQKSVFGQCGAMVLESNAGAAQLAAMIISP